MNLSGIFGFQLPTYSVFNKWASSPERPELVKLEDQRRRLAWESVQPGQRSCYSI